MPRSKSTSVVTKRQPRTNRTCSYCGRTVKRPTDLPRHELLHAPNKNEFMYACPVEGCHHQTLQKSNLSTHIRTHTRTQPFLCPEYYTDGQKCTFKTADPSSLHRHRKRKHGYRPRSTYSGPIASGSGTRAKSVESSASYESEESFELHPAASAEIDRDSASLQSTSSTSSSASYSFVHVPYFTFGQASQSKLASSYVSVLDHKFPDWVSLPTHSPSNLSTVDKERS
ncbi:hypothetical protein R3P38DRAFT_2954687 [Favolaschia claudopus]|uniref:C2H2-type domain-containing protein n=1 Tax=Favolaschia claudopus TaxID=2862362 RepID=A0AAW0BE28_9AGAR